MFCVLEAADQSYTTRTTRSTAKLGTEFHLSKTYKPNGETINIDFPTWFYLYESYDFNGLAELYPKLVKWSKIPNILLIRSSLVNIYKPREKFKRNKATFDSEHLSSLITIDIDSVELPRQEVTTDLKSQADYVFNKILHKLDPATFPKGIAYIMQASSSSGIKPGVRGHFFIESDIKVTQGQLHTYFTELNKLYRLKFKKEDGVDLIDLSYYDAAHAQYVADPRFLGCVDPYKSTSRIEFQENKRLKMTPPRDLAGRRSSMVITPDQVESVGALQKGTTYINKRLERSLDSFAERTSTVRQGVLAVYHTAYQECFDMDKLEEILRPMIREKRPDMLESGGWESVDSYIMQGKTVSLANIMSNINRSIPSTYGDTKIELIETKPSVNTKIPRNLALPKLSSITIMKASLGAGKTTRVHEWWESGEIDTMLTLTDNISLVEANASRFGGRSFNSVAKTFDGREIDGGRQNIEIFRQGTSNFEYPIKMLSGTVQSVKKVKDCKFDMIFIDEAASVMETILTSPTMGKGSVDSIREEVISVLSELFEHADRIVLADGDMSEETVNAWLDLCGTKPFINRIDHMSKSMSTDYAFNHRTEESVWRQLLIDSVQGSTCLMVTDLGPDALNTRKLWLENQPHKPKVAVIHAESKLDATSLDILNRTYRKDPEDENSYSVGLIDQGIDILLTSPSVTGGVDWFYFDKTYAINKNLLSSPNKRFQAIRRDRRIGKDYHYYCKQKTRHLTGYASVDIEQEKFPVLFYRKAMYLQEEKERSNYAANLRQLFMKEGCMVESIETIGEPCKTELDEADFQNKLNKVSIMQRITEKPKTTKDAPVGFNNAWEMKTMAKAFYGVQEYEDISDEVLMQFLDEKPHKKAEYLDDVLNNFYEPFFKTLETQNINYFKEYFSVKTHAANFYNITGDRAPETIDEVKAVIKRTGMDLNESLVPESFDFYRVYVGLDEYKKLPDKLNEYLTGHVEEVRDM